MSPLGVLMGSAESSSWEVRPKVAQRSDSIPSMYGVRHGGVDLCTHRLVDGQIYHGIDCLGHRGCDEDSLLCLELVVGVVDSLVDRLPF
jgi:hypothetical protein